MSSLSEATLVPSDASDMSLPNSPPTYGPGMNHAFRRVYPSVQMTHDSFHKVPHNFEFKTDSSIMWRPRDSYFECKFKVRCKSRTSLPSLKDPITSTDLSSNANAIVLWSKYVQTQFTAWKAKLDIIPGSNTTGGVLPTKLDKSLAPNIRDYFTSLQWLGALQPLLSKVDATNPPIADHNRLIHLNDLGLSSYTTSLFEGRSLEVHDTKTIQALPTCDSFPSLASDDKSGLSLDDERFFNSTAHYLRRTSNLNCTASVAMLKARRWAIAGGAVVAGNYATLDGKLDVVAGGENTGTNIEVGDTVILGDVSLRVLTVTDQGHLVLPAGMAADTAIVDVRNIIIIPKVANDVYFLNEIQQPLGYAFMQKLALAIGDITDFQYGATIPTVSTSVATVFVNTLRGFLSTTKVNATAAVNLTSMTEILPKLFEPDPVECAWSRERQIGENFQWTPLPMDSICRRFQYSVGGSEIIDFQAELGQRAALRVRSSKSNIWRSTVGSRQHVMSYQPEDLRRNVIETAGHHTLDFPQDPAFIDATDSKGFVYTSAGNAGEEVGWSTKNFMWQPPTSLFDINHGIPGAYHKFTLNFQDKWMPKIYENLGKTVRGLDLEYEVQFVDMVFVAALTQTSANFDTVEYTLSFEEEQFQMVSLGNTSVGTNMLRFSVPANTIGLFFYMQDTYYYNSRPTYLLAAANRPSTQFAQPGCLWQSVNKFQINYGGRDYPSDQFDCPPEQQDQKWLQTFSELGMLGALGGCETVEMWKNSGSFVYFRTIRDATENSTDVLVRLTLSKKLNPEVALWCCAIYPKSFVLQGLDGRVVHSEQLSAFGVKDVTKNAPNLGAMARPGAKMGGSRWRF